MPRPNTPPFLRNANIAKIIKKKVEENDIENDIIKRSLESYVAISKEETTNLSKKMLYNIKIFRFKDAMKCIEKGADVNYNENGEIPLNVAAGNLGDEAYKLVRLLVRLGADINSIDRYGNTPLIISCYYGAPRYKIAMYLIEKGANLKIRNRQGYTAYDFATMLGKNPEYQEQFDMIAKAISDKGYEINERNANAHEFTNANLDGGRRKTRRLRKSRKGTRYSKGKR
jgi:hypothetical protein